MVYMFRTEQLSQIFPSSPSVERRPIAKDSALAMIREKRAKLKAAAAANAGGDSINV
jgi:hypothetical protein